MTDIKFIVARYKEDISWITKYIPTTSVIVYNKFGPLGNLPYEINIPNVGRESETYLHYIIDNYDNLPEICVFTQGNVQDHPIPCGDRPDPHNFLIECALNAARFGYSRNHTTYYGENAGCWGKAWNVNFGIYWNKEMYKNEELIAFNEWFCKNIVTNGEEYPKTIAVFQAGLFAVSKKQILSRPKAYYEKLIDLVNWSIDPIEGHFFERSWYYIFNCHKLQ